MSEAIPNCTAEVNLITILTLFEASKSCISRTLIAFVSFRSPVPKYKLLRCAAYILFAERPGQTKILTPFTVSEPLFHHCVPCAFVPFAPNPFAANPPNACT